MHLIQMELEDVTHLWNTHRIRSNEHNTSGIPDEMYLLPHIHGLLSNFLDFVYNYTFYIQALETTRAHLTTIP